MLGATCLQVTDVSCDHALTLHNSFKTDLLYQKCAFIVAHQSFVDTALASYVNGQQAILSGILCANCTSSHHLCISSATTFRPSLDHNFCHATSLLWPITDAGFHLQRQNKSCFSQSAQVQPLLEELSKREDLGKRGELWFAAQVNAGTGPSWKGSHQSVQCQFLIFATRQCAARTHNVHHNCDDEAFEH